MVRRIGRHHFASVRRNPWHSRLLLLGMTLLLGGSLASAGNDPFVLEAGAIAISAGEEATIPVILSNESGVRGFSFGLRHDPSRLTLEAIELGSATLSVNAGAPDYFFTEVSPDGESGGVVAVLFSLSLPLLDLPPGDDQLLAEFRYGSDLAAPPASVTSIDFASDLGNPEVETVVALAGSSMPVSEVSGSVTFLPPTVQNLNCTLLDPCLNQYEVTWNNPVTYGTITLSSGGVNLTTLLGFETTATVELEPGQTEICVAGAIGPVSTDPNCCEVELGVLGAFPTDLVCEVDPMTCEASITWRNVIEYQSLEVYENGVLTEVLGGTVNSLMRTADEPIEFCLVAITDCGATAAVCCPLACGSPFLRADCNNDSTFNIADAVAALNALFGGASATCIDACDVNDDGAFNIADAVYALNNLFTGGPDPLVPFSSCGSDPTPDSLECESSSCF